MTTAHEMLREAMVLAAVTGTLKIEKRKAPKGSFTRDRAGKLQPIDHYWTFSDDEGLIEVCTLEDDAIDIIQWLKETVIEQQLGS